MGWAANAEDAPVNKEKKAEAADAASASSRGRPKVPKFVADGCFKIGEKLGSGSYSDVHAGIDTKTLERVAVKFEWQKAEKTGKLIAEAKLCAEFKDRNVAIPRVRWAGSEGEFNIMVMDVCGSSLEDLMEKCGGTLSVRTVLRLGIQMVDLLEHVHSCGIIHRDIKPNNFLIGVGENKDRVYIVDFGLAKRYKDPETGEHIPCNKKRGLTGTVRYTSLNVHKGIEPSRRDDLGAVGYVLMYFILGRLPWQGINARSKKTKQRRIGRRKEGVSHAQLCEGHPEEFVRYLEYCDSLGFEDRPDYGFLRGLLLSALNAEVSRHGQGCWDWALPSASRRKRARSPPAAAAAPPDVARPAGDAAKRQKPDRAVTPATPMELRRSTVAAAAAPAPPAVEGGGEGEGSEEEYESYEYDSEEYEYTEEEEEEDDQERTQETADMEGEEEEEEELH